MLHCFKLALAARCLRVSCYGMAPVLDLTQAFVRASVGTYYGLVGASRLCLAVLEPAASFNYLAAAFGWHPGTVLSSASGELFMRDDGKAASPAFRMVQQQLGDGRNFICVVSFCRRASAAGAIYERRVCSLAPSP